jgi:hypothetical protein
MTTEDKLQGMIETADGQLVSKNDRVYNYYDGWWGVIKEDPDNEGWFWCEEEGGGGRGKQLNGERIATYRP